MRRYAVTECLKQVSKLLLSLCLGKSQHLKHLGLYLGIINTNRTSAKLGSVKNYVVSLCANSCWVAIDIFKVLIHRRGKGMVLCVESAVLLAVFEKRELGYPKELEIEWIEKSQALCTFATKCAKRIEYNAVLISNDKNKVACLNSHSALDCLILLFGKELCIGRGNVAVIGNLEPSQALCTVGFYKLNERIDLLAREPCTALNVDSSYRAAVFNSAREHLESAILKNCRKVAKLKAKTDIGLIRAKAIHSLFIRHTDKVALVINTHIILQNVLKESLVYLHYVICRNEGHLGIKLGKLGLTVSSEVLVSEATRYLEITVEARNHKKLLIKLRRLRESIELALMNSRRNKIIACALGSRLTKIGGLDIYKAVIGIIISRKLRYRRTSDNISLHIGTAKVKITVAQAKLCVYLASLNYLKRRSFRSREYLELVNSDLYLTRGDILIYSALSAKTYDALCQKNEFRSYGECLIEYFSIGLIVKSKL